MLHRPGLTCESPWSTSFCQGTWHRPQWQCVCMHMKCTHIRTRQVQTGVHTQSTNFQTGSTHLEHKLSGNIHHEVYTCTHTSIHMCGYTHVQAGIRASTQTWGHHTRERALRHTTHVHTHSCANTHTCEQGLQACTHVHLRLDTHVNKQSCLHIHTCAHLKVLLPGASHQLSSCDTGHPAHLYTLSTPGLFPAYLCQALRELARDPSQETTAIQVRPHS